MRILGVILACLLLPATAAASISAVTPIDGPSGDIVDFGGTAMASDGTGGIVYRKRAEGRTHIFAAQFDGSRWRAPQRVDGGQRFDSSWPVIGAGNGGRLVVAWVQEFGPASDSMTPPRSTRARRASRRPCPSTSTSASRPAPRRRWR